MINSNLKDEIHKLQAEMEIILGAIRRHGLVKSLLNSVKGNPRHQSLVNRLMSLQPSGTDPNAENGTSDDIGPSSREAFADTHVARNSVSESTSASARPLLGRDTNAPRNNSSDVTHMDHLVDVWMAAQARKNNSTFATFRPAVQFANDGSNGGNNGNPSGLGQSIESMPR